MVDMRMVLVMMIGMIQLEFCPIDQQLAEIIIIGQLIEPNENELEMKLI
jgi:hypothetical protein